MRVGVIEIMNTGHIVLAETLCRIFCVDPQNRVFLFTNEKHANNIKFLCDRYPNLTLTVKSSGQDEEMFLREVGAVSLDRVYIVTLIRFFREISHWQINSRLYLIVHNLDEWFGISICEGIKKYLYTIFKNPNLKTLIYFFKVHFIYPGFKKRILEKVQKTNGCLVVLSESIRKEVQRLNIKIPVDVIPFSVFDPSLLNDEPNPQNTLRICVPGILSQYRRDYLGLLDLMEEQLGGIKNKFIIDFLGGSQSENPLDDSKLIMARIKQLRDKGFSIISHPVQFIPPEEYDRELSKADIILGNMNVVLNKFSAYGKTKETGLPFAMIKAAKPGILPDNYPVPEEISSGTLLYKDYQDLGRILISLINDRQLVMAMKKKAIANSEHFRPEVIYNQLVAEHNITGI